MDQQQQIDRILDTVQASLQDEVGDLLGGEFLVVDTTYELVTKQSAFERLRGKQVCAPIDVFGDVKGLGCLLIGIKDAIRLGGTLIMLPASELDEVMGREEYTEEIDESYGEIVNIIAGSFSSGFEEMYSQSCHFIHKELEVIVPGRLDIHSDDPVVDQTYYEMCCSMVLDGHPMGNMIMLLPAAGFGLQQLESSGKGRVQPDVYAADDTDERTSPPAGDDQEQLEPVKAVSESTFDSRAKSPAELTKQQSLLDGLLVSCGECVVEEVSALLDVEVTLDTVNNTFISKKDFFFDEAKGNQVIADFAVDGDVEGNCYLAASLRSAMRIGGQLIMLPAAELESVVKAEEFGEDITDAYGEVVNIIAGVYTRVFEGQYAKILRFKKNSLQRVAPQQVDIGSSEPIPDQEYYQSNMMLSFAPGQTETLKLLIPCHLVDLARPEECSDKKSEALQSAAAGSPEAPGKADGPGAFADETEISDHLDILLISDNEGESRKIQEVVAGLGYSCKVLGIKDNLHRYIPGELKAIYLVMKDVNEQAFGTAIKVSSVCSVPIIAAGPGWTRSKVIKAVRYGVRDILLTPATREDIEENISSHLLQLAA